MQSSDICPTASISSTFNLKLNRVGLGNTPVRSDEQVESFRKRVFISSMTNSEETPDWMSRTQHHFHRTHLVSNIDLSRKNPESSFKGIKQGYCYAEEPQVMHSGAQFANVRKSRIRSLWEMKNHTHELDWIVRKDSGKQANKSKEDLLVSSRAEACHWRMKNCLLSNKERRVFCSQSIPCKQKIRTFSFALPKYGIRQTPLHQQRQTQLKIGHPALINTVFTK